MGIALIIAGAKRFRVDDRHTVSSPVV